MSKWILLEADLQGAEARVVANLAKDFTTLKLFDSIDVHRMTAAMVFNLMPGWAQTVDDVTPDRYEELNRIIKPIDKNRRFIGKKTRHGGNYDMGKHRHMIEVNNDAKRFGFPINISEWRAGENLKNFHKFNPKLRETYHAEIREFVLTHKYLINPFGRKRQFFERLSDDKLKETYAQIPQSTIPDHLRMAGLRIEERVPGIRYVVESHDALTSIVLEDEVEAIAKITKEELEKPIDFSNCSLPRGPIIIPAEFQIGYNYRDLEEFKFEA